ncbi:hypothetical protein ACJJTC_001041 [Scirpophaga incertulas]
MRIGGGKLFQQLEAEYLTDPRNAAVLCLGVGIILEAALVTSLHCTLGNGEEGLGRPFLATSGGRTKPLFFIKRDGYHSGIRMYPAATFWWCHPLGEALLARVLGVFFPLSALGEQFSGRNDLVAFPPSTSKSARPTH